MRKVIAAFQRETQSNSVLDFIIWVENRKILENSENQASISERGKALADELIKKSKEERKW